MMLDRKRLFDIIISTILLTVLLPVLLVIAALVKGLIGSPVLFRQIRPGYKGAPFALYKFRSMTDKRDKDGILLHDSERLTPFGMALRASSLDELPELFNVLRGEMSLVGPRPLLMQYLSRYTAEQARRHEVKPGITGWAQINGRNAISWESKFKLDLWYIEHQTMKLDLKILLLTIKQVFQRRGIHQDGHATAEEFLGGGNERSV